MDFRKLGNLLMVLGAAVLVGACIWWFVFYSSVVREVGRVLGTQGEVSVLDARSCLYSSSGMCSVVSGIASVAGRTPYEPMLFWFGLGGLALGGALRLTAKSA